MKSKNPYPAVMQGILFEQTVTYFQMLGFNGDINQKLVGKIMKNHKTSNKR